MQRNEENNRMGKTRDLFKKIRDTKGTFHSKMGSIKDRNGMDLTEAEDIKKRWQEYTEELYKKRHPSILTSKKLNRLKNQQLDLDLAELRLQGNTPKTGETDRGILRITTY